ncbi:MAG TPA: hypothetical protein VMS76_17520 [Planctomycetota bacterium]|nr:hypothetical protein [Planctomycetota bacterium]
MSGLGDAWPDALRELILEVLRDRRARRFALDPAQLARAAAALVPRGAIVAGACDAARLAAAQRELERVHAAELAFLLREAASLLLLQRARSRDPASELDTWRACTREALEACAADALALDARAVELLEACLTHPPPSWPSAVDLARLALRLEPCDAGRLRLAQAWMAEGEPWGASGVLALGLSRGPASRLEPRLLAGLARAQSACGERFRARNIASLARARRREGVPA